MKGTAPTLKAQPRERLGTRYAQRLRSTGQALLAMLGTALGGIASNALTGVLVEHVSPNAPYVAGGAGALLLGLALPWLVPPPSRPEPEGGHSAG